MLANTSIPILGFIARSGTGKTTLLKKLITLFKSKNFRVAVIKHSHHNFEIDKPGKDSYELRMSGAEQMLIASKHRWALITENSHLEDDVDLSGMIQNLDQNQLDIIFVEGFKYEHFPKIEIYRAEHNPTRLSASDPDVIAVASNEHHHFDDETLCLDLNNPKQILDFIIQHFNLNEMAKITPPNN